MRHEPPEWTRIIDSKDPGAWADLLSFRPSRATQFRIAESPRAATIQDIEGGWGHVNLDYYPIRIIRFPWDRHSVRKEGGRHGPQSLLELFRRFLLTDDQRRLFDPSICRFAPFDKTEKARWERGEYLNTLIHIDMKIFGGYINPDDGTVVCSDVQPDYFRVSTVYNWEDMQHPVRGSREFGIWRSSKNLATKLAKEKWKTGTHHRLQVDEWTFYTRAADRISSLVFGEILPGLVFGGGHALWLSLQKQFSETINKNGGYAVPLKPISQRVDWDVVEPHWNPHVQWVPFRELDEHWEKSTQGM